MKYVIDCCTAMKWFVVEDDRAKALLLLDDFKNGNCELLAPDLFPTEMANALPMAETRSKATIGPGEAASLLILALQCLPAIVDAVPLLPRAQEIAKLHRRSVYDCLYVALAEREQCQFVTADEKLVNTLQAAFPFIVLLAKMP